ncbi:MAG: glycosyltransferase [Burkholderiales bacterium]|jgi:glycosyltransferase involved in cell wall biosynthesis|nr:glycosyltransferase [Burkholderiales bacterium]
MKFSILLPTRNRLELLRFAVQSVLDQDHSSWEIIISDNASSEDVAGYARSLEDERVVYVRSEQLIPVTDNWNLALEHASGDYVLMLGDDDCLMRGCLSKVKCLIDRYAQPDIIYTEAVQYAYPGVVPGRAEPFVQFGYCEFLRGAEAPFWLKRNEALRMVAKSLRFEIGFSYNMQHTFVSRSTIEQMRRKGPFFQSPYPDYYATNALFLVAQRILVYPDPIVAIGISPKSFGFYYFNLREEEGVQFLRNIAAPELARRVENVILPGSNMNTSWLLSMEALVLNFGSEMPLRAVHWRYRFMQLRALATSTRAPDFFAQLRGRMTVGEHAFWFLVLAIRSIGVRLFGRRLPFLQESALNLIHTSHPRFNPRVTSVPYRDILALSREETPESLARISRA